MFVPCPHCGFLIALIVSDDGAPQRCPRCQQLLQMAQDEPVVIAPAEPLATQNLAAPRAEPLPAAATQDEPQDLTDPLAPSPTTATEPAPPVSRRTVRTRNPSFARVPITRGARLPHWPELALLTALIALLALQLLLAQRAELAADARWRPWIVGLCGALSCEVPAWREPAAYTMLSRSVQPRPGQAGVLGVDASFRNDARWPQPWPTLLLSLSDIDGNPVGMRAFAPAEYAPDRLSSDPSRPNGSEPTIAPGQSVAVQFAVVEPAPDIVAFTFDFH